MYALCKGTRFTHLPVQGGWYDQSPRLVDCFETIMHAEARAEARRQELERRNAPKPSTAALRRRSAR